MTSEPTQRDIYDRLAAVDKKLDAYIARVDERLSNGSKQIGDHEARLRLLEQAKWKATGAAACAGMVAGTVASTIIYHVWD